jgi:hypothetical protein
MSARLLDEARRIYADGKSARTFEHDLILHLDNGYVFSTPEIFVMGRPVRRDAGVECIFNPEIVWPRDECDCWHIYLMAGSGAALVGLMPWWLPWVSMERDGRLRFHELGRAVDFFKGGQKDEYL